MATEFTIDGIPIATRFFHKFEKQSDVLIRIFITPKELLRIESKIEGSDGSEFESGETFLIGVTHGKKVHWPLPAAACPRCGGWTNSGGMSQYSKSREVIDGRTGCTC